MASPTAVGSVGLGSSVAGGFLKAYGAEQGGIAKQQMYEYQAGISTLNAQIARQNADYTMATGEINAVKYGAKAAQQFSSIRTAQGASGLDVNSGSNADVQASQKKITALDFDQIRSNAAKTSYDYKVQATGNDAQASLYRMAGVNAKSAGDLEALGSIIGSAESVSSKWLQGKSSGLWGN